MKNILKFILILFSISYFGCEGIEIGKPISTNKDTTTFTVEGRYINGSTNMPYRNIELTLQMDNYGYPRVLEDIAGPVRTDKNGYFKFQYKYIDRFPIYLKVFPTDLYPNIDSIPMNSNVNITKYKSTFGSLILNIEPKTSKELFVCTGKSDTIHYTNISIPFSDTITDVPLSTTVVAWGRTMKELRSSLKSFGGSQQYLRMYGDPYYNKVLIQF